MLILCFLTCFSEVARLDLCVLPLREVVESVLFMECRQVTVRRMRTMMLILPSMVEQFRVLQVGEGCPIYPTRVDSSLVFVIQQTRNRVMHPIPSNWHKSFPLPSIRHTGSRFVRDLENIVDLDFEGGLKMLSIWVDSIESTWIVRIDWSLWPRFKNKEGSCIVISQILTSGGLYRVVENRFSCCRFVMLEGDLHVSFFHVFWLPVGYTGQLKILSTRVDSIELKQIVSPVVDLLCRKSICEMRLCANLVEM